LQHENEVFGNWRQIFSRLGAAFDQLYRKGEFYFFATRRPLKIGAIHIQRLLGVDRTLEKDFDNWQVLAPCLQEHNDYFLVKSKKSNHL
jgi:hypothetical protein